jgi:hypothetical protein
LSHPLFGNSGKTVILIDNLGARHVPLIKRLISYGFLAIPRKTDLAIFPILGTVELSYAGPPAFENSRNAEIGGHYYFTRPVHDSLPFEGLCGRNSRSGSEEIKK